MSRVLVIEDDEALRSVIADTLREQGYEVSAAAHGAAGLAQASAMHPDLILCDIIMPGMSGYDVLSALRRDPSTAATAVIFLTGVSGPHALRTGMDLGADDYLVKPVQRSALLAAVASRLERSAALRKEAEACLQKLRDDLARTLLPHEFLTPLTAVMGLASLLMEEGAIEARDIKEVGRGILAAGQMLEDLIGRFLAYAELHATTAFAPTLQAEKALENAREEAERRALAADRADDLDVSGEPVPVPMPPDHWLMLIRELVDNALKFSGAGSSIALSLTTGNGATTLTVRDQGCGMSAAHLEGLVRRAPFLRRHQHQAGLGLGLSIVRRLLQLYAGELSFETVPGHGTTVRVRFPALKPATAVL